MRSLTALRSASRTSCTRTRSYSDRIWGDKLRAALPWPGAALGAPLFACSGLQRLPGWQWEGSRDLRAREGAPGLERPCLSSTHPQLLQGRNLSSIKCHPALTGDQQEWRWPEVRDSEGEEQMGGEMKALTYGWMDGWMKG